MMCVRGHHSRSGWSPRAHEWVKATRWNSSFETSGSDPPVYAVLLQWVRARARPTAGQRLEGVGPPA